MIISKATEKEVKSFTAREWKKVDVKHYGENAKWASKSFILKARENKKIVGVIKFKHEVGVVHIKNIIIAENKRRQGIGRQLIVAVEKIAKKLNAHKIFLFTGKNWPERSFYEKLGYKKTADFEKHFFKQDFVVYSKII